MRKLLLSSRAVPRWVILLVDLIISGASFTLSYFIVKNFEFAEILRGHFFYYTFSYCYLTLAVFYVLRIHTGLIRYSNYHDMMRIFFAVLLISLLYPLLIEWTIAQRYHIHSLSIPEVLFVNFFISYSLLVLLRVGVKEFYHYIKHISVGAHEAVLVYGSGTEAILVKQAIESGTHTRFYIAGFIDNDKAKVNTYIEQKKIFHINALPVLKKKKHIGKLILMNDQLSDANKKSVIDKCLQAGIKVLTVPPSDQWVYGKLGLGQIQELSIEDLLQRDPIVIDNNGISAELCGKRILVTGAAGSIGSEIVRQALLYQPEMVIMIDQAESAMHEVQLEVEEKFPDIAVKTIIASVRDHKRMFQLFRDYKPHLVFHAAAYKHVPMMERHPVEAVLTNVMGTRIVADLSAQFAVHKFVMISTDKAVNPTNIMGATKRIAEMYVQSLEQQLYILAADTNGYPHTKFITTRFGNVLGSNGSVIPRFRAQIRNGGPVTVTHPEINRFFMTIPEAVQLVLEAAAMGKGSEIFVFDMGKPVKIVDLAIKMIRLAGLVPGEDISIAFTGLRPGEKLYEELLNNSEMTLPTHHEKIKIARVMPCSPRAMNEILKLIDMGKQEDNFRLVKKMKELVPDFKSKNSQFEKLDQLPA